MDVKKRVTRDDVRKYFIYFMMYSSIGWIYEVFLEVVVYRWGFRNRGVLFGPYLPVYGVGTLVFLFLVYRLIRNKPLRRKLIMIPVVFLACGVTATIVELIASYIAEGLTGTWPWQNYFNYKYNFHGRIALNPSIRFGLGGLLFLYVLQPLFEKIVGSISEKNLRKTAIVIFVAFIADLIYFILFKVSL